MAAPANPTERVRASKLRKRIAEGKLIAETDRAWLRQYETRTTIAKAKRAAASPVVRGPQLAIGAASSPSSAPEPAAAAVHETVPITERIDPAAHTWIPEMPAAVEGAEPAPEGTPPPPAAGTPLIDVGPESAPAGDPAAAEQFAALVVFLTTLGLNAGREMAGELAIPEQLRALLASDELGKSTLETVHAAASRVAIKYGFKSVPMGDEVIVIGAVLGSGALVVKNAKRKKLAAAAEQNHAGPAPAPEAKPNVVPKSHLDRLWEAGDEW